MAAHSTQGMLYKPSFSFLSALLLSSTSLSFPNRFPIQMEYLTEEELKLAKFGLKVAYLAHDGQVRKSGEPFIIHPVAVAGLLAELRVDCDTVLAGLLHDTVEDTELTFLQLELLFGRTVRRIVEGETKVSKLPKIALMGGRGEEGSGGGGSSGLDEQAENLRQMFIAMSSKLVYKL
jgi:GTP pyrophosphokinase